VLSGTGGLTIDDGVDQTLTGTNTYTGETIIASGGSLSLTGTGSIADSSGVTDNGTFDISGLTGDTSITTLSGSGSVALGDNNLTLTDAGSNGAGSGTFSGDIDGNGGLDVAGGTETLTGTNTYTGGTTIDSGATLQLGDGTGTNGSITGDVTDNGTLAFDYMGSTSFGGNITGSGDVSLIGGTLTLTGANDYTGGTTIGAATLIVAGEGNLGTGDITMLDGSALEITGTASFDDNVSVTGDPTFIVAPSTTTTWSGLISGTGDVVATGGGTLALTNTGNTYSGGTVVEGGSTLLIGNDGEIGATTGGLTLGDASTTGTLQLGASFNLASTRAVSIGAGGGIIDTNSFNTTISQAISGAGALTKIGTGTLALSGDSTFTGTTTISAGTLQLGSGGATGSVAGDIVDNAALAFDYSGSKTYAGTISGTGSLTQMAGTTMLTGDNTYTGGTTISGGTLQLGSGGTSGSITGNVADSGTLAFDRSDAVTFGGMVSGSGGLTQSGTGVLTLTANNSFTGTTTIGAGSTLQLGNGGTTGAVGGNIADSGTLLFDRSNATAYGGVISGSGSVQQNGLGTLTLTGASTYTGTTTVNSGTLAVNGSISHSAVTVNTGATLTGTGTVGSTNVEDGATLSPGNGGIGTLNVNGDVTFGSTSDFAVDVSSASNDKLLASGGATIESGATLTLTNTGGTYHPGQQFTLLTASGGVDGSFTLAGDGAFGTNLTALLIYPDANDVVLQLKLAHLLPHLSGSATRNETSVITAIDAANDNGDVLPDSFINLPSLSSGNLQRAADQMSGEVGAVVPQVATSQMNPFMTLMFDHMTSLSIGTNGSQAGSIEGPNRPKPAIERSYAGFQDVHDKTGFWLSGFGGNGSNAGVQNGIGSTDVSMDSFGLAGGVDYHVSPYFMVGASLMGGHTGFDLSGARGTGTSNAFEGGLYGLVHGTGFYVAAAGAYSNQSMSTDRTVDIPTVTTGADHLSASFTARDYGGRLEAGVYVNWLTPYIAVQTLSFNAPAYSETAHSTEAADFALDYGSISMTTTRFELGTGFGTDVRAAQNSIVNLWGRVGWAHDLVPDQKVNVAFAGLADSNFTVYGAQPATDSALVSLGVMVKGKNGLDLMARVDSDISGPSKTYIGTLGFNFTW
jgi:outer membrane autotransporter protein